MRCRVCKQQGTNLKAGGFCPKCLGLNEPLRKLSLASQVELADRRMALEREAMQAIEDALAQHPMAYGGVLRREGQHRSGRPLPPHPARHSPRFP